jgi:hypothetical protein
MPSATSTAQRDRMIELLEKRRVARLRAHLTKEVEQLGRGALE